MQKNKVEKVRLTKIFRFEMAHALSGYDGKCKDIHGHSYTLHVTISGYPILEKTNPKKGMILDFGTLKEIVKTEILQKADHALMLDKNGEYLSMGKSLEKNGQNIFWVDYTPTCEMILIDFADRIKKQLPKNIILEYLRLYETKTSYGEWYASDNP